MNDISFGLDPCALGALAPAQAETLVGLSIDDPRVPTPSLLVEEPRLLANIARAKKRCRELGVTYRPHVKTHKSIAIARMQTASPEGPITVSTLAEARAFAAAGVRDILFAVGIAPQKLAEVKRIRDAGCDLKVILDSLEAARAVSEFCERESCGIPVLLEIDVDGHRSGIPPESPALLEVARGLTGGARLAGVLTHAGESYEAKGREALVAAAEAERAGIVRAAGRLRAAGLTVDIVSLGSTPTLMSAVSEEGVTEIRAGVCVFFDLFMTNVGVCSIDDIAVSVLTTVIGRREDKGIVLTDSGFLALSRDRGTQRQAHDYGYGLVRDLSLGAIGSEEILLSGTNQEHGLMKLPDPAKPGAATQADFPLGRRVRILPNHACPTAAPYAHLLLVRDGVVKAVLGHVRGWE